MILIFGGAYQGKLDFAKQTFGITDKQVFHCSQAGPIDLSAKALHGLEQAFLPMVKSGQEAKTFLEEHKDEFKDKIVIINDISQGIVPIDRDLRAWREMTGRAMLYLAGEADEVYRVFCGIGQQIK